MTTVEFIPAEHRRVYLDALMAARKTVEERGHPFQDEMALADMHRVIYHGSIKPLMAEVDELKGELLSHRLDFLRELREKARWHVETGSPGDATLNDLAAALERKWVEEART